MKKKIITVIFVIITITILTIIMIPKAQALTQSDIYKSHIINLDLNGDNITEQYRIIKVLQGNTVELLTMYNVNNSIIYDSLGNNDYNTCYLNTYLNNNWYNTLSEKAKSAIIDKTFINESWYIGTEGNPKYIGVSNNGGTYSNYQISLGNSSTGTSMTRHVYALSLQDIIEYLVVTPAMTQSSTTLNYGELWYIFWNDNQSHTNQNIWLRTISIPDKAIIVNGNSGSISNDYTDNVNIARAAFQIDLTSYTTTGYTVTSNVSNGTLSASGSGNMTVEKGATWSGYITPNTGYDYPQSYLYLMNGRPYGPYQMDTTGSINITNVQGNLTIIASCTKQIITYTVSSNIQNGTLSATGSGNMTVEQGETWSGYITPNEGYDYPLTYQYMMGTQIYGPFQMESLGSINIPDVQGNLMIAASCIKIPKYTKLNIENPDDDHIYLVYSSVNKNGYPAVSDDSTATEGYTIITYQVDNGYSMNYSAFMQEFDGKCEIEIIPNTNNQSFKLYHATTQSDITAIPYTNVTNNTFSIITINGSTNLSIENTDGYQETNFVITNNTTKSNPFTIIFFSNPGHSLPTEYQIESWLSDNNYRPIVNYTYSQATGVLTIYGNNRTIGIIPQEVITLSLGNSTEYNRGYQDGINQGKHNASVENQQSITDAFNEGQEQGYQIGYNKGIAEASEDYGFGDLFFSISNVPVRIIRSMFNYEIFGINIALVVLTLITVVVTIGVVIIIKKTIK